MEEVRVRKIVYPKTKRRNINISEENREKKSIIAIKNFTGKPRSREAVEKMRQKLKGRITNPNSLFKEGNQFGKLRKNRKISDNQKLILSIKMIGKPCSEKAKKINKERLKENNPMKNPEIAKKNHDNWRKNFIERKKIRALENRRNNALNNPNIKKNWFKQKVFVPSELIDKIKEEYLDGKSILFLSIKYELHRKIVKKVLVQGGINIRKLQRREKSKVPQSRRRKKPFSEEERIRKSERLILNNPMKNPEISEKVKKANKEIYIKRNIERDKLICELYFQGLGCRRISKKANIPESTIINILKRNGMNMRGRNDYQKFSIIKKEVYNENLLINNPIIA